MGHKYDYEIDLSDDSAPARVVRMVGRGKRVLEIGAGPGSMTRVLRDQLGCRVTAVEIDEEVIEALSPFCERVYRVDLNEDAWLAALQSEAKFEVIVVADVLEHLYDPWSVLPKIKTLLAGDGCLIVSVPHAGHNAVVACLLGEDLGYRDSGLLDRTHIRFFGLKNIQSLFDDAGLAITESEFVMRPPQDTELWSAWNNLSPSLRIQLSKNEFGDVYQVVVKAVPVVRAEKRLSLVAKPEASAGLPERSRETPASPSIRLLAVYLPQFHPTAENDLWWGKGFTEWTNVTQAEPLFEGHYQPHLPSDLGFYDLRLRETRHEQISLAKQYGIDGFCYYYYWFSGKRILNQPLDDMLADPESNMPFCLSWANENWTRKWDGADQEVLIAQQYLPTDAIDFIKSLIPFFNDPRYIRVDGAPFFIVYQPHHLPEQRKTIDTWREYCHRAGIGKIHVCGALTNDHENYINLGFDSGLQFPPHNRRCGSVNHLIDFYTPFHGCVVDYGEFAQSYLDIEYPHPNVFRTVCPSWDQTPRVGSRAFIVLNGTPANYEYWLSETIKKEATEFPQQERLIFINAWNEWAEGCHIEPDQRHQRKFLEATLRAKTGTSQKQSFEDYGLPKPPQPRTSVGARLEQVQQDLQAEIRRRTEAEQDLSAERARLAEVYKDLAKKRST
jgi:2-polyprenyl-3-methyl-5-hydroxy-6-metoxy-1,4-benzoquinol methylase